MALLIETGIHNDLYFSHQHNSMHEYYDKEMGEPLSRFFVGDMRLRSREDLVALKLKADVMEKKYCVNGARTFNFDPGYVAMEQMVLATGKPYSHRPYLGDGVYAELTYAWEGGQWRSFPWTYPDYADGRALEYFELLRQMLKGEIPH